jgi:hypothetical protein
MHEDQWLYQVLRLREEISRELADLQNGRVIRHNDPASEEAGLVAELATADRELDEICFPAAENQAAR